MRSLNSIRKDISDFFDGHPQVNYYSYGTVDNYISVSDKNYYAVNLEFVNADVSGKYINYSFSISISDLMNLNYPETEHDAVSSCILIGNDFLAWLTANEYTFGGANMEPFREDTGDICAGVVLGFSLQIHLGLNECAIPEPYKEKVLIDSNTDVVIDNNDNPLIAGVK